jgi:GTP-dependent dephospho-CoA kinase
LPGSHSLPEQLRPVLGKPLGALFTASELKGERFGDLIRDSRFVISVGDRVTETLGSLGRTPDVQVVDGKENRKGREPPDVPFARLIKVSNPPGTLTDEAIEGVRRAFEGMKPVRILVDGEEDLMAIPVIALAPVSAVVFYGQPGEGIVAVRSDAKSKSRNR